MLRDDCKHSTVQAYRNTHRKNLNVHGMAGILLIPVRKMLSLGLFMARRYTQYNLAIFPPGREPRVSCQLQTFSPSAFSCNSWTTFPSQNSFQTVRFVVSHSSWRQPALTSTIIVRTRENTFSPSVLC